MSTLKQAVESGRRWTHPNAQWNNLWYGPGQSTALRMESADALSSDFIIEPEPEKPREWTIHIDPDGMVRRHTNERCGNSPLIRVIDADAAERLVCASCRDRLRGPR